MLRLRMFGGLSLLRVDDGGASVDLMLQRRGLALLALIAASHAEGLSRDKLLLYLWPESDTQRGRNALRQTLHTLRRDLGAADLLLGNDTLRLNSELLVCDVAAFEEALRKADYQAAAEGYRGPFLDGFHVGNAPEFERWVDERRSWFADRAQAAMERVAITAGQRWDTETAAAWWRRLSLMDPLNSRVALGLMHALVAGGNPSAALQHAQLHDAVLRDELGAAADKAVTALAERIRAGTLPDVVPPAPKSIAAVALSGSSDARRASFHERVQLALAGRYRVDRELERTRSGRTRSLLAFDLRHDRPVILKLLNPRLASQLDTARFIREIKFTASLSHPNLLPLLDSGQVDGHLWYSVPHIAGESLRERLAREHAIPVSEAVRFTRELADAADHAHRHGVIHRDIAPENVVLAESHAVLTNLGLSRALNVAAGQALSESGAIVGTPAYMSPEQATGDRPLDGRSDLYSLACVLYEMAVGEPLYSGPTPQSIMAKRRIDSKPAVRALTFLPAHIRYALMKALEPDPDRRFAYTADFADALLPGAEDHEPGFVARWITGAGKSGASGQ